MILMPFMHILPNRYDDSPSVGGTSSLPNPQPSLPLGNNDKVDGNVDNVGQNDNVNIGDNLVDVGNIRIIDMDRIGSNINVGNVQDRERLGGIAAERREEVLVKDDVVEFTDPKTLVKISQGLLSKLKDAFSVLMSEASDRAQNAGIRMAAFNDAKRQFEEYFTTAFQSVNAPATTDNNALEKLLNAKKAISSLRSLLRSFDADVKAGGNKFRRFFRMGKVDFVNPLMYLGGSIYGNRQGEDDGKLKAIYEDLRSLEYQMTTTGRVMAERQLRDAQMRAIGNMAKDDKYYADGSYQVKFDFEIGAAFGLAGWNIRVGGKATYGFTFDITRGGEVKVGNMKYFGIAGSGKAELGGVVSFKVSGGGGYSKGTQDVYKSLKDAIDSAPVNLAKISGYGFINMVKSIFRGRLDSDALNVDNLAFVESLKKKNVINQAAKTRFYSFNNHGLYKKAEYSIFSGNISVNGAMGTRTNGKIDGAGGSAELNASYERRWQKTTTYTPIALDPHAGNVREDRLNANEAKTQLQNIRAEIDKFSAMMRYLHLSLKQQRHMKVGKLRSEFKNMIDGLGVRRPVGKAKDDVAWQAACLKALLQKALDVKASVRDEVLNEEAIEKEMAEIRELVYHPQFPIDEQALANSLYIDNVSSDKTETFKVGGKVNVSLPYVIDKDAGPTVDGVHILDKAVMPGVSVEYTKTNLLDGGTCFKPKSSISVMVGVNNSIIMGGLIGPILNAAFNQLSLKDTLGSVVDEVVSSPFAKLQLDKVINKHLPDANSPIGSLLGDMVGVSFDTSNTYGLEFQFVKYGDKWHLASKSLVNHKSKQMSVDVDTTKVLGGVGIYTKFGASTSSKIRIKEWVSSRSLMAQVYNYQQMAIVKNISGWKEFMKANEEAFVNFAKALNPNRAKGAVHATQIDMDLEYIRSHMTCSSEEFNYELNKFRNVTDSYQAFNQVTEFFEFLRSHMQ